MKFEELEKLVLSQQKEINDLKLKLSQNNEFMTEFSGKVIFNKEVQFMQRVRRRTGTIVTTINNF